ncbi:MAG: HAD hydrolase family protein [Synergistaceae bacterium]|nr:HAD hydrolase family protein [Synergistaceae bacterium]
MYIFFDIDNTLISHRGTPHIPPATLEAVRRLKDSGHVPAIATGRAGFLTMTTAKAFGIEYLVCAGGSEVFAAGKKIHTAFFPDEYLDSFRNTASRFPEITAVVDEKYLYADSAFDPFRSYFNAQAGYDCFRPMNDLERAIMCYIMRPHSMLDDSHGIFFSPPGGVRLEIMRGFTEARHADSTKWSGIELMMRSLGAGIDDVITFGDGPNDADMLRRAKIGVAVGICSDVARNAADYVCDDIDAGGILEACEHLGLL